MVTGLYSRAGWGLSGGIAAKTLDELVDDLQAWLNVDDVRLPDAKAKEIINITIRTLCNKYMSQHNLVQWSKYILTGQIDYNLPSYVLLNYPHQLLYYEDRNSEGVPMRQYGNYGELHSIYPLKIQETSEWLLPNDEWPHGLRREDTETDPNHPTYREVYLEHHPLFEYYITCYSVPYENETYFDDGSGSHREVDLTIVEDVDAAVFENDPDFSYDDPAHDDPREPNWYAIHASNTGKINRLYPDEDYDLLPRINIGPLYNVDAYDNGEENWWGCAANLRYCYAVPNDDQTDDDHPCAYAILGRGIRIMPVPTHSNGFMALTYYSLTPELVEGDETNNWLSYDWDLVLFKALAEFGPSYIFEQERIAEFKQIADDLEEQFAVREGKRNQAGNRPVSEEP